MTTHTNPNKAPTGAVPVSATPKKTNPRKKHLDIDQICAWLEDGENITAVAKKCKVNRSTLNAFLAKPDNSARAMAARLDAAAAYADMAEDVIAKARSPLALAKARELAHHYRWRAGKHNPKHFGDKVQVEADVNMQVTKIVREFI